MAYKCRHLHFLSENSILLDKSLVEYIDLKVFFEIIMKSSKAVRVLFFGTVN